MSMDGRYAAGAGMRRSGYVRGWTVCRGRRDAQERLCPYIGVKYIGVRRRSAFKLRLKPRKDRKAIVKIQISCQLMFLLSRLPSVRECAPTFGLRTTLCCGRDLPEGRPRNGIKTSRQTIFVLSRLPSTRECAPTPFFNSTHISEQV